MLSRFQRRPGCRLAAVLIALSLTGAAAVLDAPRPTGAHVCHCPRGVHDCHCPICSAASGSRRARREARATVGGDGEGSRHLAAAPHATSACRMPEAAPAPRGEDACTLVELARIAAVDVAADVPEKLAAALERPRRPELPPPRAAASC